MSTATQPSAAADFGHAGNGFQPGQDRAGADRLASAEKSAAAHFAGLDTKPETIEDARQRCADALRAEASRLDAENPGFRHIFHAEFVQGPPTGSLYLRAIAGLATAGAYPNSITFSIRHLGHVADELRFVVAVAAVPASMFKAGSDRLQ
jgi:hypothetical protein